MVDSLLFPKTLFKHNFGFGMDFGSSVIKVTYTTEEGENLRINFTSFPISDLDRALEFLTNICDGRLEPGVEIRTSGIGSSLHQDRITEALNIRLINISEGDTMANAFKFITTHAPWDDVFYPASQLAMEHGSIQARQYAAIFTSWSSNEQIRPWPYMKNIDENDAAVRNYKMPHTVKYPAILSIVGSAFGIFKIHEDAKCEFFTMLSSPGGRTFLGLGALLMGVKSFDELIDLASRGEASKVDQLQSGLLVNEEDDMYKNLLKSDNKIFAFGHAVGRSKDEFRREDIAAALVSLIVTGVVSDSIFWASEQKIQQVFFIGGFATSNPYIRLEIEKEFALRRFANFKTHMCDCRFMKHGAHLGAIGTLMENLGVKLD